MGCHNGTPETRWTSTIAVYSPWFWGWNSESEVPIPLVSSGSCLPGLQMAALCLGLHVAFSLSLWRAWDLWCLFLSSKNTSPIGLGTHPMTSFSISYLTKGPISKYCHIKGKGVRISTYESSPHLTHTPENKYSVNFFSPMRKFFNPISSTAATAVKFLSSESCSDNSHNAKQLCCQRNEAGFVKNT